MGTIQGHEGKVRKTEQPYRGLDHWMCGLSQMSIPSLISGHLQKLGYKMDNRKYTVENLRSGVG